MHFSSTSLTLFILFITAALSSRFMLLMIDDPEGPNLLVVFVLALFVWVVTVCVSVWIRRVRLPSDMTTNGFTGLFMSFVVQVIIVAILYLVLK